MRSHVTSCEKPFKDPVEIRETKEGGDERLKIVIILKNGGGGGEEELTNKPGAKKNRYKI